MSPRRHCSTLCRYCLDPIDFGWWCARCVGRVLLAFASGVGAGLAAGLLR